MSKNNNFIERSILGALAFLKAAIFADEYAAQKGFLQSLDPRIKAATFFLFIVQILFLKDIAALLALYGLCLLLARLSNINLAFFLKRTWVFIPLFSLLVAIPALFSVVTPGDAIAVFNFSGLKLVITHQGLAAALLFVTRVITSVSFVVLLSITTKHFELLRVLRIFGVPQIFVMTAGICYRYVYLFVEIIENTYFAIKSRVGQKVNCKFGRHIVAWNIACLWQCSYQLNEEVYKAMLSRGFRGEPVVLVDFKAKAKDWLWLVSVIIISIAVFSYC
ncbi:MAG: cobalt ECF transporter T component CbiQ [Candidatus Omnitrophota bacterium]